MGNDQKQLIVVMLGRMGDLIAVEPVLRHLAESHADRKRVWYTTPAFAAIYRNAPFFDAIVEVRDEAEYLICKASFPADALLYEFNLKSGPELLPGRQFPLLTGLTHDAFPELVTEGPRFYFDETVELPQLPERYAVFHCTSNGRRRHWPEVRWNALARRCLAAGLPVVEIGFFPILTEPGVIHCCGNLDLQVAAGIIRKAYLFVGMESGFAHLANAAQIFGIIIAGKLAGYPDYQPYTGFYSPSGNGCNLVRFYDEYPLALPSKVAVAVLDRFLAGQPMSFAECQKFCLTEQVKTLRDHGLMKIFQTFSAPWRELRLKLLAHRQKHR